PARTSSGSAVAPQRRWHQPVPCVGFAEHCSQKVAWPAVLKPCPPSRSRAGRHRRRSTSRRSQRLWVLALTFPSASEIHASKMATSTAARRLDRSDVDLFHLHHRIERALGSRGVGIGYRLGQSDRRNLPG